jgi:hypothetical protein
MVSPRTLTSAPWMTAPLGSVTVPSMVEVVVCAAADAASSKNSDATIATARGTAGLGITLTPSKANQCGKRGCLCNIARCTVSTKQQQALHQNEGVC